MDTREHLDVGNRLRFNNWDTLNGNPYIHIDEASGILSIDVQGVNCDGLPYSTQLRLSSGDMVAMSGDYFGGREVDFKLPTLTEFNDTPANYDNSFSLGNYLINKPITDEEEDKFRRSYSKLANPNVKQSQIATIYTIDSARYVPFFDTLNGYAQQAMFALRVKNYSDMLLRNLSHFTPWSVLASIVGHHLALNYAELSYEFRQWSANPDYISNNEDFNKLRRSLAPENQTPAQVQDLAYRFQALALGMEFFSFHYYSDHFAAGHCQPMGDLRVELPKHFGTLGSILVNNLHDEANRTTIFMRRPYDPNPDETAPPIIAGGDGDFDDAKNYYNKQGCVAGMQASLDDLNQVFQGGARPAQANFAGLKHLPDIDPNYRQPQPLFIFGSDHKIYYRSDISKIRILSPSQWQNVYDFPAANGYTELASRWTAFLLVAKLRLLSFIYEGKVQELSADELQFIEQEEHALNPNRRPIPQPPVDLAAVPVFAPQPQAVLLNKQAASSDTVMAGLGRFGLLAKSGDNLNQAVVPQEDTRSVFAL